MPCPKARVVYPDTSTLVERPFAVMVRRVDPEFDRERARDLAYRFERRAFLTDPLASGAYGYSFNADFADDMSGVVSQIEIDAYLTSGQQDGTLARINQFDGEFTPEFSMAPADAIAAIDVRFKVANGFCDPVDDGTVFTGTGAGGANPGTVPSVAQESSDFSSDFTSPNAVGAIFDGGNLNLGEDDL